MVNDGGVVRCSLLCNFDFSSLIFCFVVCSVFRD